MFHFCPNCWATRRDLDVDHEDGTVTCPACGESRGFRSEPLLVITGASGVGKTTIYREVVGTVPAVLVEPDLYWLEPRGEVCEAWRGLDDVDRRAFHLLQYATIMRSGRPVVAVGAALGDPGAVERLPEADYFPAIHYLALVCDPDEQARRIRARPGWADVDDEPWADVERQQAADARYRELAEEDDDFETVDTTEATVEETVEAVRSWIRERV